MKRKALILGITGQDGSYLAELLLAKGYEVHGLIRRSATGNLDNISHLLSELILHRGDLTDTTSLYRILSAVAPDELYNEADQDHVAWSFDGVGYTCDITGAAVGRLLEVIRLTSPATRVFQPVSSNMFGQSDDSVLTEHSAFRPQSPYAAAKVFAFVVSRYYRDVFKMFVSTAILFNHESPRRPEEYVSRKISKAAAQISKGIQKKLTLGDIDGEIDFGFAGDYMEAAWRMLQLDYPDDFIISTGEVHSVREFLEEAFAVVGLDPYDYVEFDSALIRPGRTATLIGDHSKAKQAFGFDPKIRMKELVRLMVNHDVGDAEDEAPK